MKKKQLKFLIFEEEKNYVEKFIFWPIVAVATWLKLFIGFLVIDQKIDTMGRCKKVVTITQ
jgi:hypothetical protein